MENDVKVEVDIWMQLIKTVSIDCRHWGIVGYI